jgi:hypothetical protein
MMRSIADALVYATAYISSRTAENEELQNEDDSAMGHVMAYLSDATPEEEDALANAAKRALAEEQSLLSPQQEMIDLFSRWMELIISRDWDGNDRSNEASK